MRHVLEWLDIHKIELLMNWNLIRDGRPGIKIAPLE